MITGITRTYLYIFVYNMDVFFFFFFWQLLYRAQNKNTNEIRARNFRCTRARVSSFASSIVSLNERSPVWLHYQVHQGLERWSESVSYVKRIDIFEPQIFTCSCDFLLAYRKLVRHTFRPSYMYHSLFNLFVF